MIIKSSKHIELTPWIKIHIVIWILYTIKDINDNQSWPTQKIHKNVSWNVSLAAITQINILSYNFVSLIRHLYAACLNELHDLIKINLIFFFLCYYHIFGCWHLAKKCVICSLLLKLIKDEYQIINIKNIRQILR